MPTTSWVGYWAAQHKASLTCWVSRNGSCRVDDLCVEGLGAQKDWGAAPGTAATKSWRSHLCRNIVEPLVWSGLGQLSIQQLDG